MQTNKDMSMITIIMDVDIAILCRVMTSLCGKFVGNVKIGTLSVGNALTCLAISYSCTITNPAII